MANPSIYLAFFKGKKGNKYKFPKLPTPHIRFSP